MRKNLIIIVILALSLNFIFSNIVLAKNMIDIENTIYEEQILKLHDMGIISGFPDGTYRPENSITRAEFAKILALSLKLDTTASGKLKFQDVKDRWHEGFIEAVFNNGLMLGKSENVFDPDSNLTREEVAVILIRAFKLNEIIENLELSSEFIDKEDIAPWAMKEVLLAHNIGLLEGINSDGALSFLPKRITDRQLIAKLIYELLFNKDLYLTKISTLVEEKNKAIEENESLQQEQGEVVGETQGSGLDEGKKVSMSDIVSKYSSKLGSLQSSTQSKLDSLVASALSEIDAGASVSETYNKYLGKAKSLESSTDSKVSSILSALESELIENGYDTSPVSDLQKEYESIKSSIQIEISL